MNEETLLNSSKKALNMKKIKQKEKKNYFEAWVVSGSVRTKGTRTKTFAGAV